ncbi:hypothetical protein GQ602_003022 [Ophiocordyceps camponoti-floridani]|uniref:Uncharacterized protein n=1 Tax=Ophiocordyceps camponoti-floridani TaxID=2030778 RepID=A0A8H4Q7G2_9HYPO|nr:hypothetical protein GQ602_003022 [Ophiocordyceps camponoti-floridani]
MAGRHGCKHIPAAPCHRARPTLPVPVRAGLARPAVVTAVAIPSEHPPKTMMREILVLACSSLLTKDCPR